MQQTIELGAGQSGRVTFTIVPVAGGVYETSLDGLAGSFEAVLPAAEFTVTDLQITPSELTTGEAVEISALVTNIGGTTGIHTVTCDVTPGTYTILALVPTTEFGMDQIVNLAVMMMMIAMVTSMVRR